MGLLAVPPFLSRRVGTLLQRLPIPTSRDGSTPGPVTVPLRQRLPPSHEGRTRIAAPGSILPLRLAPASTCPGSLGLAGGVLLPFAAFTVYMSSEASISTAWKHVKEGSGNPHPPSALLRTGYVTTWGFGPAFVGCQASLHFLDTTPPERIDYRLPQFVLMRSGAICMLRNERVILM